MERCHYCKEPAVYTEYEMAGDWIQHYCRQHLKQLLPHVYNEMIRKGALKSEEEEEEDRESRAH